MQRAGLDSRTPFDGSRNVQPLLHTEPVEDQPTDRPGRLRSGRYPRMDFQSFHPKNQGGTKCFAATGRPVEANTRIRIQGNP